ncbi:MULTISPECIES: ABC transporter substrate-binding protein [unclassified Leptolyngbya]|uniref:ABC transporter substrate-binding protein n=1 Tax=unclassified Leptolyngbya TaxID=2650499 RepID=UPI001681E2FF|nr:MULTISPECIES: ABC transporter substrate-binding protein [unclassified Leptolyngbya]MBD1910023.1 ABC transporter substrate-binding protein [Leptolyngbya sp. FACHB-8]MBD2156845.1 ABC transporter substrate-binding protein [Leptolyngbya sp. FACHB-16]
MAYTISSSRRFTSWFAASLSLSLTLLTSCTTPSTNSSNTASTTQASSTEAVTLRIGFTAADGGKLPIGPIGWAEHKGYLDDALADVGISDVQFAGFDSGPAVNEAVAASELDISMNGDTPAIVGKTNGLRTRLVNLNQVGINVYLISKKDGPTSLEQLKGKTVGVRVGAIPHRYLVGVLEKTGLSDVKLVNLNNSEGEAALARGDIDAYAATSALAFRLKSQGYTVIDEAANHADLTGSNITSITEEFLKEHPDFVQKWYEVIQKATDEIKSNPQAYYQFVSEINDQPLDVSEFTSPTDLYPSEPLPADGLERLRKTQQFLVDEKIVKSQFPFDEWVYR